jgi:Ca2+-binding EF-hand superfamily protein
MGNKKSKQKSKDPLFEDILRDYNDFKINFSSGLITFEEIKINYGEVLHCGLEFGEHIFILLQDKNEKVDFREFLCMLIFLKHDKFENKLALAFKLFDKNNSGLISQYDVNEILSVILKTLKFLIELEVLDFNKYSSETCTNQIFEKINKNENNSITFDEFLKGAAQDPWIMRIQSFNAV